MKMRIKILSEKTIFVSTNEIGRRIDNFLCKKLKYVPKSMIYRLLRKGKVRVNKKRVKPKYKLVIGDGIYIPPIRIFRKEEVFQHLQRISIFSEAILYEDDCILVLNKPSGIAVHGGSGLNFGIIECLRKIRPKEDSLELVHRLDRETSGVLLVAKKFSALRSLHNQLRKRKIQKDYLALVKGHWRSNIKTIQVPLRKKILRKGGRLVQVDQEGKLSETFFEVEKYYEFATLIRCIPITGRTHQIRVHAKYAGHPIAFDNLYGDRKFDKQLEKTGLSRLFLHATAIKFFHPNTGKTFCITAPLDKNLKQSLEFLCTQ